MSDEARATQVSLRSGMKSISGPMDTRATVLVVKNIDLILAVESLFWVVRSIKEQARLAAMI